MGRLRLLSRTFLLVAWTFVLFAGFLLTWPLVLCGRSAARWRYKTYVRTWARGVARIMGMRIEVHGHPPRGAFFLVANHLSYMDIVVFLATADCVLLSKSEVASWPVIGMLARASGTLFVDRNRRGDLPRVIDAVEATLAEGHGVVVFPEGTSTRGDHVLPFKPSLFEVAVRSSGSVWCAGLGYATPPGEPDAGDSVCWWGDATFVPHISELLRMRRFDAWVAYDDGPLTGDDRKELARRAHERVSALFEPLERRTSPEDVSGEPACAP